MPIYTEGEHRGFIVEYVTTPASQPGNGRPVQPGFMMTSWGS